VTIQILPMTESVAPVDDSGLGCLRTEQGNLPLAAIDVAADITGLAYRVELTQEFVNPHSTTLEATYVFPLPDRAAVTGMSMTAADRVIEAVLQERAAAREAYDKALAAGQRASIAEEERPDVFTMRVGNILPGERVTVALTMAGPLAYTDGAATFRFPLVVAPRYIPGAPLDGAAAGDGWAADTDAVPDASRITPPVLLPGFPNPVRLSLSVGIDPAGLELGEVRSSLHAVSRPEEGGRWRIAPGERANRDFVLRLGYGSTSVSSALALYPDASGSEGTFDVTVLPPVAAAVGRPRDVVLVLDRSGSMAGWKMVSARRAAARIVDTLTATDRFAVLTFDTVIDRPEGLASGLVEGSDRNRYRAVRHLSGVDARGGTEMAEPLRQAVSLLSDSSRDRVLILVTDGQVGNEDQILRHVGELRGIRVHTIGIDRAVNAGFLGRLAGAGGGLFELVESEDRLDEVMTQIHRRLGAPLVSDVTLEPAGLSIMDDTVTPSRLPDLFPGVPLVIRGRYREAGGGLVVRGRLGDGSPWSTTVAGSVHSNGAGSAIWARSHLRDLEDRYAVGAPYGQAGPAAVELERRIVETSLRFGVLCRFTAYVAVDPRVVAAGEPGHRVIQPVEPVEGWDMLAGGVPMPMSFAMPAPAPAPAPMMPGGPGAAGPPARAPKFPMAMGRRMMAQIRDAAPVDWTPQRDGLGEPAAAPVPPPAPGRAPLAVQAREQLDRLRAATDRVVALRQLAEWLEQSAVELTAAGADAAALAAEIRSGAVLVDDLWARAIALLERLADVPTRRRAFWKRD
jgi:Ca-activated chloride channel homolog